MGRTGILLKKNKPAWASALACMGLAVLVLAAGACNDRQELISYDPKEISLDKPPSFPQPYPFADNPLTLEGVDLGRRLFYDPILSDDSSMSCASCHRQEHGFATDRKVELGIRGNPGPRNSMALANGAWQPNFFWDGRALSLEHQALMPIEDPLELDQPLSRLMDRLRKHPHYPERFRQAFGSQGVTPERLAHALAQFQRSIISANAPMDRWRVFELGGASPFRTAAQFRGFQIFASERGDCFHCHGFVLGSDFDFHNNGLDANVDGKGRGAVTGRAADDGKFKTPSLRNIGFSAPYMHDGRFATLEQVIDFYSEGLKNSRTLDPLMKNVSQGGIRLNAQEKKDLLEFLKLFNDTSFVQDPAYSNPNE